MISNLCSLLSPSYTSKSLLQPLSNFTSSGITSLHVGLRHPHWGASGLCVLMHIVAAHTSLMSRFRSPPLWLHFISLTLGHISSMRVLVLFERFFNGVRRLSFAFQIFWKIFLFEVSSTATQWYNKQCLQHAPISCKHRLERQVPASGQHLLHIPSPSHPSRPFQVV
jgi:hypothetical protein